ncbi:MAG: hypothetical protein PHU98_09540 [Mariniphaga sp.]|jgi:hypothetical protein|nr:hypothetical protein [Mariniphaga sp.]
MRRKSKYGFPPPNNRIEFEHNLALIYEEGLRKSKSKNKDVFENFVWAVGNDLKKVNFLPNGRINLLSINESLRLQGNSLNWMEMLPPPKIINDN